MKLLMTCEEMSKQTDLGQMPKTSLGQFRRALHIGICTGCRNYARATAALKKLVRSWVVDHPDPPVNSAQVEKLNQSLLKKYS